MDANARKLAESLGSELAAVRRKAKARAERGEETRWDPLTRIVTWESRRGEVIGRWYGEVVATYVPKDRIVRWSWAGKSTLSHAEIISRVGAEHGVPQLAHSLVADLDEAQALELVELGIVVAHGQGMLVVRGASELELVGLFDSARPREGESATRGFSLPPPEAKTRSNSNPPTAAAAAAAARGSRPPGPVREPARAIFVPVAHAVLEHVVKTAAGYKQALFVIRTDPLEVSLTILDGDDLLRSLDAPRTVTETATRMVAADRADGNGPWRKLSARIVPKTDGGATLTVDVL
jgi:hypothetical protein